MWSKGRRLYFLVHTVAEWVELCREQNKYPYRRHKKDTELCGQHKDFRPYWIISRKKFNCWNWRWRYSCFWAISLLSKEFKTSSLPFIIHHHVYFWFPLNNRNEPKIYFPRTKLNLTSLPIQRYCLPIEGCSNIRINKYYYPKGRYCPNCQDNSRGRNCQSRLSSQDRLLELSDRTAWEPHLP